MWQDANTPVRPVQISMDAALLRRIDADPEVRQRGRSAFIRSAIEMYLEWSVVHPGASSTLASWCRGRRRGLAV